MNAYRVTWRSGGPGERTLIGGVDWQAEEQAVIDAIEAGRDTYYILHNDRRHIVTVFWAGGGKMLLARDERGWSDLMLHLPRKQD